MLIRMLKKFLLTSLVSILSINTFYLNAQDGSGSIYGFITDEATGEALIGANVIIIETGAGMATDMNGYYVIQEIADGDYTVLVSYVGYQVLNYEIKVSGQEAQKLDLALTLQAVSMSEVEVSAEKIQRKYNIQPSRVNLSPRMLKAAPSLAEPDLFRTIQALPGVLTTSEFSTGLVIRGGNTDQNLILLDGITVYNPSHLGGVFSNFIVDGVKEANLIKGGYNAEYGGRLSAVLNVLSREGNRNKFDGKMSVSLLSAQTTLEGPSYNGAWLVSARRTYFDQIFKNNPNIPPYYFYDFQGHVFSDLSPRDRLSISFYSGLDDFTFNDLGLSSDWGNNTISLTYRRVFSERLIGNFLLASSEFFTNFGLGGEDGLNNENLIKDKTFSANMSYFQSKDFEWRYGLQVKQLGIKYRTTFEDEVSFDIQENPVEGAAYAKLKWKPNLRMVVEPGLRYNFYSVYADKPFIDLRLGTKYLLTDDRYINFAFGNYHQFIETIQDDFNPPLLDNWLAVDESVDPASAQQYILGYEEYFQDTYKLQIEGYYKDIQNMLTYEEFRSSTDADVSDENVRDTFTPSDGYAYGLELFGQKMVGKLTGWIGYTYSVSRKIMDSQYSDGTEEYYTNWDRAHALSILGSYVKNDKWDINFKWSWQSGQAYTPILGYYLEKTPGDPNTTFHTIPGVRNSGRYPAYHRLDLGAVRHGTIFNKKAEFFIQLINTYNRKNIFRYVYRLGNVYNGIDDDGDWVEKDHDANDNGVPDVGEVNVDEEDEGRMQRRDISLFPVIPTIGITIYF